MSPVWLQKSIYLMSLINTAIEIEVVNQNSEIIF